jgi:MFS family permease
MPRLALFFVGRFFGALADEFLLFAIPVLIFRVTGDVAWLGAAFLIEWLPRLVSLPTAGAVVDRFGPRPVYLVADALRFIVTLGGFLLLDAAPGSSLSILLALAMLSGFCFEQTFIAIETIVQRLAPKDQLVKTQALLEGIDQTCHIAGPLLAGLFVAQIELIALLPLIATLFSISFLSVLATRFFCLEVPGTGAVKSLRIIGDIRVGVETLLRCPKLGFLVILTMLSNLIIGVLIVELPAIVTGTFLLSPTYLGMLNTMAGATGVATMFLIPGLIRTVPPAMLGQASFVLTAGLCLLAALSPNFWAFAVLYALVAATAGAFVIYIRMERVRLVPSEVYGRTVGTIVMANFLPMPIAGGIVGLVADQIGLLALVGGVAVGGLMLAIPLLVAIKRSTRVEASGETMPAGSVMPRIEARFEA